METTKERTKRLKGKPMFEIIKESHLAENMHEVKNEN